MSENENPYAAPLTSGGTADEPRDRSVRRHPWFSRALTVLLAINALSFVSLFVLVAILDAVFVPVGGAEPPIAVILPIELVWMWLVFAWPITSLTALIYCATIDRGTPRALPKAIIAFLMLAVWVGLLLLIVLFA